MISTPTSQGRVPRPPTLLVHAVPKVVLLLVANPKDVISNSLERKNGQSTVLSKESRMESEVSSLQTVCEWHPNEIAKGKHETKAVRRDIHRCQHRCLRSSHSAISRVSKEATRQGTHLIVQCIKNVDPMHQEHKPHASSDLVQATEPDRLFA
jgi:hypothetical protein